MDLSSLVIIIVGALLIYGLGKVTYMFIKHDNDD